MALSTVKPKRKAHSSSKSQKTATSQASGSSHARRTRPTHSRSAPELSIKQTALGPATTQGWVRPKGQGRKKQINPGSSRQKSDLHDHPKSLAAEPVTLPTGNKHAPSPPLHTSPGNRMSIMSFASGSTKIGEIPERKGAIYSPEGQEYLANTVFPLAPWKRPEKPRSRFMRLFKK